ncbi:acyltransferase protein [Salix suchowensis]|nr:acyltransferase protein [Salix suchowensis]
MTGDPLKMVIDNARKGVPLQEIVGGLSQDAVAIPSNLNVLAALLPRETLLWKLNMLKVASKFANSHLHAVKAQTLVLSSGRDQLLPSEEEGQRLHRVLPKCQNRSYSGSGHFLLLEDVFDLATLIKGSGFYRHGAHLDYVSDYVPPTPLEFKKIYEPNRLFLLAISSVMLSTLEDGKIVRGLAGIPSEGPVLFRGTRTKLKNCTYK